MIDHKKIKALNEDVLNRMPQESFLTGNGLTGSPAIVLQRVRRAVRNGRTDADQGQGLSTHGNVTVDYVNYEYCILYRKRADPQFESDAPEDPIETLRLVLVRKAH